MKTSRYTETQILAILRQAEGGMPVVALPLKGVILNLCGAEEAFGP